MIVTDKAGNESTKTSKIVATKLYSWDYYSMVQLQVYNSAYYTEFPACCYITITHDQGWCSSTYDGCQCVNAYGYPKSTSVIDVSNRSHNLGCSWLFQICYCVTRSGNQYYFENLTKMWILNCNNTVEASILDPSGWLCTRNGYHPSVGISGMYTFFRWEKVSNARGSYIGKINSYCSSAYPTTGQCGSYYYISK